MSHLKLADDPVLVLEFVLGLLASIQLEGLQPLREALELGLAFQLVGIHLTGKGLKLE
jgi:hypothetical protein